MRGRRVHLDLRDVVRRAVVVEPCDLERRVVRDRQPAVAARHEREPLRVRRVRYGNKVGPEAELEVRSGNYAGGNRLGGVDCIRRSLCAVADGRNRLGLDDERGGYREPGGQRLVARSVRQHPRLARERRLELVGALPVESLLHGLRCVVRVGDERRRAGRAALPAAARVGDCKYIVLRCGRTGVVRRRVARFEVGCRRSGREVRRDSLSRRICADHERGRQAVGAIDRVRGDVSAGPGRRPDRRSLASAFRDKRLVADCDRRGGSRRSLAPRSGGVRERKNLRAAVDPAEVPGLGVARVERRHRRHVGDDAVLRLLCDLLAHDEPCRLRLFAKHMRKLVCSGHLGQPERRAVVRRAIDERVVAERHRRSGEVLYGQNFRGVGNRARVVRLGVAGVKWHRALRHRRPCAFLGVCS